MSREMKFEDLTPAEVWIGSRTGFVVRGEDVYLALPNKTFIRGDATNCEMALFAMLKDCFDRSDWP